MYPHHQATIQRTIAHFQDQPNVRALLLGGSVAHGFAAATSDVDVMIVVSDDEHAQGLADRTTVFFSTELATYPDGYVDGKYISQTFLKWFLAVLARVHDKPAQLLDQMEALSQRPSYASASAWYELITGFREWESSATFWPNHFMQDSELTWLGGSSPVDDL